jgi:hypothetical protein
MIAEPTEMVGSEDVEAAVEEDVDDSNQADLE